jgi:hypothetical protein
VPSITLVSQVINDLFVQKNAAPLVIKHTMCKFLQISFNKAVAAHKRKVSAMRRQLDVSTSTVPHSPKRARFFDFEDAKIYAGEGAEEEGAGRVAGEEDAVEGAGMEGAFEDAEEGAEEEDAGRGAGKENALLLCKMLKKPLRDGRAAFLAASAAFQEWVWARLDCWQAGSAHGSVVMRESIRRLVALPAPHCVHKAHPLDGLVTWDDSGRRSGTLAPGFQYRALSIWHRVTRHLTPAMRSHCQGYTPDHIERVAQWFRENSVVVQADQTAEAVKTAFKEAFGCMNQ